MTNPEITYHGMVKVIVRRVSYNGSVWISIDLIAEQGDGMDSAINIFGTNVVEIIEEDDGVRKTEKPGDTKRNKLDDLLDDIPF